MDRKDLLKILELTEQASEKDIEDAFYTITKRARNDQTIDLDRVSDAYRILTHKEKITLEHRKKNIKKANRKNTLYVIIGIIIFILIVVLFTIFFSRVGYFVIS